MDLSTGEWIKQNSGVHMMTAKRGGFDPYDNPWFGGGDGALIELNAKTGLVEEHIPPIAPSPYTDFYEAQPDANGDVWAGVLPISVTFGTPVPDPKLREEIPLPAHIRDRAS